jgi:S1-C subfamily serine protease
VAWPADFSAARRHRVTVRAGFRLRGRATDLRAAPLTLAALLLFVPPASAPAPAQGRQISGADLERIITAVGQVVSPAAESKETRGSGVIISPQGLVITCNHVLGRNAHPRSQVFFDPVDARGLFRHPDPKQTLQLEVVRTLPEYDLALLQIRGYADGRPLAKGQTFRASSIGHAEELRLLDVVYVIGFPEVGGDTVTVIEGRVAGKDAVHQWLKLDASVSRGYSGGAVVNGRGELVGVPTEIRADIEELRSGKPGARDTAVLYGFLSWVRPVEIVSQLLTAPRDVILTGPPAEPAAAVIEGTVVSESGAPLADAAIGLLKAGSTIVTQDNLLTYTRSDAKGEFVVRTAPGTYTLRTHCAGYKTVSQPVSLTETLRLQISLTKQPDLPPPASSGKKHD